MESVNVSLTFEQFRILRDLINRGMEEKLAPFDNLIVSEDEERMIMETLNAVAFFNSHAVTHHVD